MGKQRRASILLHTYLHSHVVFVRCTCVAQGVAKKEDKSEHGDETVMVDSIVHQYARFVGFARSNQALIDAHERIKRMYEEADKEGHDMRNVGMLLSRARQEGIKCKHY